MKYQILNPLSMCRNQINAFVGVLTVLTLFSTGISAAQVSSPAEFLGYELGERFTYNHRVVAYFEHVAENSDYISLEYYGESNEGRPLLVAYVTSPENHANLDTIRENNLRRAGLLEGNFVDDGKAILWMSYNIHGNEAASTEASMRTVYELAYPENHETKPWLENTVVIMAPALNPDGSERYAVWFNQVVGRNFDPYPLSREHREPNPNGRLNHYQFDLNRDWAWQTQKESQLRNTLYQRWLPHVHADFHEMGGYRYFFAPAANPYHTSITDWQKEFQTKIGKNHAGYFDADNRLYYTGEVFDLFYPSYGDTWPTFQGAIGMTYESGGSWGVGIGITTPEGHVHTLERRLTNQHIVGLSTVEVVANNHQRVASEFRNYFETSKSNPQTTYKTYILRHDGNRDNVKAMLELLENHNIAFGRAPARRSIRAFNYTTGNTETISTSDEDIIISMYQPKSVLANVLMEPRTTIVDSLTYDITAWALPYVYGVQAFATTERLNPSGDAYDVLNMSQILGFPDPVYAYVFEWRSFEDARFLAALHKEGVRVRISQEPLRVGEADFAPGALVVTRHNNEDLDEDFDMVMRRISNEFDRIPVATGTGFNTQSVDLGSENVNFAKAPKVLSFFGDDVAALSFGEMWHFFDQQLNYPISIVHTDRISEVNFHEFDVMVLPQGRYGDLFSGTTLDQLQDWLARGGRLIAIEGVISQLSVLRNMEVLKTKEVEKEEDNLLRKFSDRRREAMTRSLAGGIFRVNLDSSHPLAFGYGDTYFSLKRRTDSYQYLSRGWNVGHVPENGFTSGFVGHRVKSNLEESLNFGVIPFGRGQVIVMVDNPLFRGFWHNGKLLFSNAVFQPM